MPKVRYLKVRFAQCIFPYDIPKFRAAVIEKTERIASLFHNHKNDQEVIYRYPLIQYKVTHRKASIICLDAGTDDIHHLLQHRELLAFNLNFRTNVSLSDYVGLGEGSSVRFGSLLEIGNRKVGNMKWPSFALFG